MEGGLGPDLKLKVGNPLNRVLLELAFPPSANQMVNEEEWREYFEVL